MIVERSVKSARLIYATPKRLKENKEMKCEHCGYDDHGTGDTAHACPRFNRASLVSGPVVSIGIGDHLPDHAAMADMINKQGLRIAELEDALRKLTVAADATVETIKQLAAPAPSEQDEIATVADRAMDLAMKYSDEVQVCRTRIAELEAQLAAAIGQRDYWTDRSMQLAAPAPSGYKLVPIKPTDEMLHAINNAACFYADELKESYRALLAAAPAPASSGMLAAQPAPSERQPDERDMQPTAPASYWYTGKWADK